MTRLRLVMVFVAFGCGDDGAPPASSTGGTSSATSESTASSESSSGSATSSSSSSSSSSSESTGAGGLLDVYDLEGDMLFPEGVAFDPVGQAFFVGSLSDGSIHRITAEGEQAMFSAGPDGNWSTAGVKVDAERGRVWACSTETDGAMVQAVWVLDLGSGDVVEVIDLAEIAEGSDCNDVALDAMGVAYVSDPPNGVVHRIEEGGARAIWATHPDFAPTAGLGLNGLAVTPDGAYLVLAKFLPATLFRIAIQDPTDVVTIDLSGDPFTGESPTSGADGIAFDGDALYVTFAEHVKRVDFTDAEWMSGTVTNLEVPGAGNGLSTCTAANGSVYAAKSEVTAWVLGQEPELPFQLIRVVD